MCKVRKWHWGTVQKTLESLSRTRCQIFEFKSWNVKVEFMH